MSFWKFIGELALLEWLFGSGKRDKVVVPPPNSSYKYRRKDDNLDKIHLLESRIDELERQQDKCDISPDRYDELQDKIDDLQAELDELDDNFYDDL